MWKRRDISSTHYFTTVRTAFSFQTRKRTVSCNVTQTVTHNSCFELKDTILFTLTNALLQTLQVQRPSCAAMCSSILDSRLVKYEHLSQENFIPLSARGAGEVESCTLGAEHKTGKDFSILKILQNVK